MPLALDPFGLLGATLDTKYEVSACMAEGGFAVVYRALHVGLHKPVALKVLKVPSDLSNEHRRTYLEKFAQEARLIAALDHPAIVRVLDFGVAPLGDRSDTPWMALEWLDGTTLEQVLESRRGQPMEPAAVFALMEPVIDALACAHESGVVHRDLKPANLMRVTGRRGEAVLKVLDFGIAKTVEAEDRDVHVSGATRTSTALIAFSPHYAAPEQITGMRTGPWTDVHALALVLVEMLCGRPPYLGDDPAELYAAALAAVRPTPAALGVDVGAWESVLAQALAFKPSDRFADAKAFLDALRATLPDARLSLRPAPPPHTPTVIGTPAGTLRGAELVARPAERPRSPILVIASAVTGLLVVGAIALSVGRRPEASPAPRAGTSPIAPAAAVLPAATVLPAPAPVASPDAGIAPSPIAAPSPPPPRQLPTARTPSAPAARRRAPARRVITVPIE